MVVVKYGEYKGNKTISLYRDEYDRFPFTFGVAKARMIKDTIDKVLDFADQADGEK
jgi:hypothetical protein